MADNNDTEYRNWLMHEMNYFGRYHDHKETMAWLATAFYITGVISVAFASRSVVVDGHCIRQTISCIFIVIAAVLALGFIGWQFQKRYMAANNVLNIYKKLKNVYDNHQFIKVDDPPDVISVIL
jgi:hypothetical protein